MVAWPICLDGSPGTTGGCMRLAKVVAVTVMAILVSACGPQESPPTPTGEAAERLETVSPQEPSKPTQWSPVVDQADREVQHTNDLSDFFYAMNPQQDRLRQGEFEKTVDYR